MYNSEVHFNEVTKTVTYGAGNVEAAPPVWDGDGHYNVPAVASEWVNFDSPASYTVTINVTPKTRNVMVRFNYLYRGSIVHTEEIPASVTFGSAPASVTPTWDGYGDYIVPEATPVSVGFDYQGEVMTVEITVTRPNNNDNPQVPLGPGTEGNPEIPLGLPRTGDAPYSLLSLLVFAGISLAAKARKRVK